MQDNFSTIPAYLYKQIVFRLITDKGSGVPIAMYSTAVNSASDAADRLPRFFLPFSENNA